MNNDDIAPPVQRLRRNRGLFPLDELNIGIKRVERPKVVDPHTHEFTEVAIVENGHAIQAYDNTEFEIATGDVFMIPPDRTHSISNSEKVTICNVLFIDDGSIPMLSQLSTRPTYQAMFNLEPKTRDMDDQNRRLRLDYGQLEMVKRLTVHLDRSLRSDGTEGIISATIHFLEIITFLCDVYETSANRSGQLITGLSKANAYIEANFRDSILITDVARAANMSLRSFQRHFLNTFKVTPIRFIHERRLKESRKLLRTTDSSIASIAFEVGFKDPTYFSRAFHDESGISPKQYRNGFGGK